MNGEAIAAQAVAGGGPGGALDPPDPGGVRPDHVARVGADRGAAAIAAAGHALRATRP